jgi:8-oxo-dGTP pyrophosphatase MutT (NUDIX family)
MSSEPSESAAGPDPGPRSEPGPRSGADAGGRGKSSARRRRADGARDERSAGGVVVRDDDVMVIVPTRRAADGARVVALPKGHLDGKETELEAATREVREETGVSVERVARLGEVRYTYRRSGRRVPKTVVFFLFRYLSGDPADHDDEIERAYWMPLSEAVTKLSYEGEREMVARALARLQQDQ